MRFTIRSRSNIRPEQVLKLLKGLVMLISHMILSESVTQAHIIGVLWDSSHNTCWVEGHPENVKDLLRFSRDLFPGGSPECLGKSEFAGKYACNPRLMRKAARRWVRRFSHAHPVVEDYTDFESWVYLPRLSGEDAFPEDEWFGRRLVLPNHNLPGYPANL